MQALLAIALKSLLIAGLTLGLLALLKSRSPAERSWVAHIGLLALVTLAFAPMVLPALPVEAPALFAKTSDTVPQPTTAPAVIAPQRKASGTAASVAQARPIVSSTAIVKAVYAVPAAILLFITFLALGRLLALRARAEVLVDGHWLSALARAQRRMGFKHGTALLTSKDKDLASPISWGLMRPVILLNERAVEASGEAEAIIAHELAHVARLDWAKLLLARFATALFWFNPLVWLLAREAHQLREETADDAVLESNIADTDYAQLLVGVARHECSGLLLGAHGVAPSRSSLARRVARVLDSASVRGPVARPFALGVFVGALVIAAPLAALTLTPSKSEVAAARAASTAGGQRVDTTVPYYSGNDVPQDLPHIIAQGVSTSVAGAVAAIHPTAVVRPNGDFEAVSPSGATVKSAHGLMVATSPNGATVTVYPPDAQGRRKVVAVAPSGATAVSWSDDGGPVSSHPSAQRTADDAADKAIEMRAAGVTPDYVRSIVAVAPQFRNADTEDFAGLKASGVTPAFVQELVKAGYRNFDAEDLEKARTLGVTVDYLRSISAAGYPGLPLDQIAEMRAVGLSGADIARFRKSYGNVSAEKLVELKTLGVGDDDRKPPRPPAPPKPPSGDDDDGG
jgi:bla regulator protein BlaR1